METDPRAVIQPPVSLELTDDGYMVALAIIDPAHLTEVGINFVWD